MEAKHVFFLLVILAVVFFFYFEGSRVFSFEPLSSGVLPHGVDGQVLTWEDNKWVAKSLFVPSAGGAIDLTAWAYPIISSSYIKALYGDFNYLLVSGDVNSFSVFTNSLDTSSVYSDYIDFNISYANGSSEGRLQWNSDDGTLEVGMPGGNVNLQIGQEEFIRCKATEDLGNGEVVYISGASGSRPECSLAIANSQNIVHKTIAVATEDISSGNNGYVTTFGLVRDIDTSVGLAGEEVYLDAFTSGDLNIIEPVSPNYSISVGTILFSNSTSGVLFVNPHHEAWKTDANITTPIPLTFYESQPARNTEANWNGGLQLLSGADTLNSSTPISVSKGTGKLIFVVNSSNDAVGDINVYGDIIDRTTQVKTSNYSDIITLSGNSTDNSTTAGKGGAITVHDFSDAYITNKWFTGSVTISTSDVDLTDVDVYHVSFEQVNDQPNITIKTLDASLYTTNANAEFDAYLFVLDKDTVTGKVTISNDANLNIGTDGETALVNKYWRLRKGNINKAIDGTTDGFWVDIYYLNNPTYIEDITLKLWLEQVRFIN